MGAATAEALDLPVLCCVETLGYLPGTWAQDCPLPAASPPVGGMKGGLYLFELMAGREQIEQPHSLSGPLLKIPASSAFAWKKNCGKENHEISYNM